MGNKFSSILILSFLFLIISSTAYASISLYQWGINLNGTFYYGNVTYGNHLGDVPGLGNDLLDPESGLGTLTWHYTAAAEGEDVLFISWFDHEIDEYENGFINEYGSTGGVPGPYQMWEIDEPMYLFGDIAWNVNNGVLDSSNSIFAGSDPTGDGIEGDDVSMALGWNFVLNTGDRADIALILSEDDADIDGAAFFLSHTDPDSHKTVYFQGELVITRAPNPVPLPGAGVLLAAGLVMSGVTRKLINRAGGRS